MTIFRNIFSIAILSFLIMLVTELISMHPEFIIENRLYFSILTIFTVSLFFIGQKGFDLLEKNNNKGL